METPLAFALFAAALAAVAFADRRRGLQPVPQTPADDEPSRHGFLRRIDVSEAA